MTTRLIGFEATGEWCVEAGVVTRYVDGVTGLRHVHMSTSDPHVVVALALHTPTPDRPGLPHMLEHWVGTGSRLFPARHLFPALLTRTAASFLNAFTGPDHTGFVAATTCLASAELLTDALVDGVFRPLLHDEDFAEEAWGVDPAGEFTGVVWQEAVTRLDDPQSLAVSALAAALYEPADLLSMRAQGLQPLDLVGVTPDEVRRYHARQYHPRHAWLISAGDLPAAWFQERASRLLGKGTRSTPLPAAELRPASPDLVRVTGAGGAAALDALVGVRLESTAVDGAFARAKVLNDLVAMTPHGPLRDALKACGATRYAPGSGVHTVYPHTILGVGFGVPGLDDAGRAHQVLAEALPSAFRADDVRTAAGRRLLEARDRSHLPHPAPVWAVQQVLDTVGPLVHGADAATVFDVEGQLLRLLDEPERVLELTACTEDRIARVVVDNTGPSARAEFDSAAAEVQVAPMRVRRASSRATAAPPLISVDDLAPRRAPGHPVQLGDALWLSRNENGAGVDYAVVDVDLTGLDLELLPITGLLAAPLNHNGDWRSRTEIVVQADPADVDRPRTWLRTTLTSQYDDTVRAHASLVRRFETMRDDSAVWAMSVRRGLTASLGAPAGIPLLRSATAAQVTGAGVVQDFVDGLAGRRFLRQLACDRAAALDHLTKGAELLASAPRVVVLTQTTRKSTSDTTTWDVFAGACGSADPPAIAPVPGDPVSLPPVTGSAVVTAYRAVPGAHPDAAADLVLAGVLDRRLYRALRMLSAHGSKVALAWPTGTLTLATAGSDRLDDVRTAMADVLAELSAQPPDDDELAAARTAAVSSLNRTPSVHDRAADAVRDRTTGGDQVRARLTDSVRLVDRDAVLASARRYHDGPAPAVGTTGQARPAVSATAATTTGEHP